MSLLNETIVNIPPVDFGLEAEIRNHLDNLTKPPGSLDYFEELLARYCLATCSRKPHMGKKMVFCFAGDHGVVAAGGKVKPFSSLTYHFPNLFSSSDVFPSLFFKKERVGIFFISRPLADSTVHKPTAQRR
ncbi:MAG TPA: nicotinate-nucleotide--dimethylbenzimidazole phosphoribosyltransferase [Thermodesulfobacteriota bacterium]|nr:nicotinate-nucleotide--dimethylbenzimidazole phosphoribosyltransferase [Thermodesulfobacteriota bacterium]